MAGKKSIRLNLEQTTRCRAMIKTDHLLKRVQDYILTEKDDTNMTQTRLRAIEVLLRKTLPDISAVQISGDSDNPLTLQTSHRAIIDPANPDS